jgi:ferredoxin-NADP reductase
MAVAQKLRCRVERILNHGDHVYTVDLQPERLAPRFRPGQFLHLALDEYDPSGFWPESRVFSMANSPGERDRVRISYSVRGRFTARMEQELEEERWVWVKLPYGEFVIDDSKDVVMFAGGTGITAFTAFLSHLGPDCLRRMYLVYGARSKSLLIYRDLVDKCLHIVPRFHATYFLEDAAGSKDKGPTADAKSGHAASVDVWELPGRITVSAVWSSIREPAGVNFYISGPPQMLRTISQELRERGISDESIRIDAWE